MGVWCREGAAWGGGERGVGERREVEAVLRGMGVEEIVVEAPRVAIGESVRDPDVTLRVVGEGW